MDRRGFLKRCGLLPFMGSLATVAQAEAKQDYFEGHPVPLFNRIADAAPLRIFNGQIFEAPWPLCHRVIVQYFGRDDKWLLLSDPYPAAQHGGNAMMVCYYKRKDGSYNPFYTQGELQEKLKVCKLLKGRLILDKR